MFKNQVCWFIIVTTPDNLHYGPAMAALEMGYHLLLEKPIAQTWKECNDILQLQKRKSHRSRLPRIALRPLLPKSKRSDWQWGVGSVDQCPAFWAHRKRAHVPFIRQRQLEGIEDTNPIILAKSCHDLDMLRWWIGKKCTHINSFGSLSWFKSQMLLGQHCTMYRWLCRWSNLSLFCT